jgi:hypothetical protein
MGLCSQLYKECLGMSLLNNLTTMCVCLPEIILIANVPSQGFRTPREHTTPTGIEANGQIG